MRHIYKHISNKSKKCLSFDNSGILSVVCLCPSAYTSLCRGLKYLLKARYIVLDFLFLTLYFLRVGNTTLFLKNTSQK